MSPTVHGTDTGRRRGLGGPRTPVGPPCVDRVGPSRPCRRVPVPDVSTKGRAGGPRVTSDEGVSLTPMFLPLCRSPIP